MNFLENIKQRAKSAGKTIVLPESSEPRVLKAAEQILREGLAKIILIGSEVKLEGAIIIDPKNYEDMDSLSEKLYELRKAKGMTPDEAKKMLTDNPVALGTMLVKVGIADGMVAGSVYSTADVLRPSLQILKTAPGISVVSSFFVMDVPDCEYGNNGVFVFSDCGLIQNPNSEELAAIALSSANSYLKLIDGEPIVAMLSHSTMGSAKHADVTKVTDAVKLVKEKAPTLQADGEFQLDAAIIPSIGASKAPGNKVAGKANVLIFPDLDSGNIAYKIVERLAKAKAYGPITQGIAKPVNDLSRGCSAEDIVGVVAITAVQAQS
ncbi:MAG: phosphate acetyltransferase [Clostridiales bacterium]|jgi:phosphate acetyltransferase|nr:phosphate acetyltransferase [Clostridiales bacterium]